MQRTDDADHLHHLRVRVRVRASIKSEPRCKCKKLDRNSELSECAMAPIDIDTDFNMSARRVLPWAKTLKSADRQWVTIKERGRAEKGAGEEFPRGREDRVR